MITSKEELRQRILLVDDDALLLEVMRAMLEELGYSVVQARSGEEAFDLLSKATTVDLVLSDVDLGHGLSGVDLVRKLQMQGVELPALLYTGADPVDPVTIDERVATVLQKPVPLDALKKSVAYAMLPT